MPLSSSAEVVETSSVEATSSAEPTRDTPQPALQLSWQGNEDHESNKEADFELGSIKKALVTEPPHPSNSGPYYSAMADDVAQLVKNQGDFYFLHLDLHNQTSFLGF